eukprot:scaffold43180_cov17-Prasinocladus_malaysianus.AAC.1
MQVIKVNIPVWNGKPENGAGEIRKARGANDRTTGFNVIIAIKNPSRAQKKSIRERGVKTSGSEQSLTRG